MKGVGRPKAAGSVLALMAPPQLVPNVRNRVLVGERIASYQYDPRKQLCALVLQAASKYPIYGVQQLPRNRHERL
jgi:hypothetical protein